MLPDGGAQMTIEGLLAVVAGSALIDGPRTGFAALGRRMCRQAQAAGCPRKVVRQYRTVIEDRRVPRGKSALVPVIEAMASRLDAEQVAGWL